MSQKLLEEIESFGGKGFFYKCDLSNREQIEKTLNLTLEKFPKIDILINNAGIVAGKSVLDVKMQEIERVLGNLNYYTNYIINRCEFFCSNLYYKETTTNNDWE